MLSVVICTHNPNAGRLKEVLNALQAQTLPRTNWELVVVDNASSPKIEGPALGNDVTLIRENAVGLTYARQAGVKGSRGEIIVFVDDDNVLDPDYLAVVTQIGAEHPEIGAFGGKLFPIWEGGDPAAWLTPFFGNLALRDFGNEAIIEASTSQLVYPRCAPVGAGMAVRRSALAPWLANLKSGAIISDRKGISLASGGDNDIVLHLLEAGYSVGYFPELNAGHIMPAFRLTKEYQARLAYGITRSWVTTLAAHQITPWPPIHPATAWLRKAKYLLISSAWRGPAHFVRWRELCGQADGRADLWRRGRG